MIAPIHKKKGHPGKENITPKKLIITKAIESDGSPSVLAKKLGVSPPTAYQHLQKPEVKKAVMDAREKALKAAGITRVRYMKKIAEKLNATRPISCNVYVKDTTTGKNIGEMVEAGEATKDFIDVDDNMAQLKAAELCAKLHRDLDDPKKDSDVGKIVVNMGFIVVNKELVDFNVGSK